MRQHSQRYFFSLAQDPDKQPQKLYSDRWGTQAKCVRVGRYRQTLTLRTEMFGTPPPFHSHCQSTHSLQNHEMFSKVQKVDPQNYLLFCKYTVSKSPGEKITFFFQRCLLHLENISEIRKTLRKARACTNMLCWKWYQQFAAQMSLDGNSEVRSVNYFALAKFVLTELAARPGQHLESSLSDMTSGKQMFFFLTFQNALYSTEECKSY